MIVWNYSEQSGRKDLKLAYKTTNARLETLDSAPSYERAFKKRKVLDCLIPSDGFNEWKKVLGRKIPYSDPMKDDSPSVFAGLREGCKDTNGVSGLGLVRLSPGANEGCGRSTRMPVILPETS
jgi:putative SOS response-associated peptidase YedK